MKRFFRDFMLYGMAGIFGKLAALLLMPVYTGILTQEEYGAMALILLCSGVIDLISNLNIHSGIARDYYENGVRRTKLVSTGLFSILTVSMTVLAMLFASRHFWMDHVIGLDRKFEWPFVVMLCGVPFGSLQSYFFLLTRFKKKPVLYMIGTLTALFIRLGVSIYGVVVMRAGIVSIFVGGLAASLFSICFFGIVNRNLIELTFSRDYLKRALLYSLPTLPAILAGWLDTSVGQVLISRSFSMEELGVYSVAVSLASVFTLISEAFNNIWSPYLFENYRQEGFWREIRRLFTLIVFGLVAVSVLLSLIAKPVVLIFSNPDYIEASRYLPLLCLPMSLYMLFPFASAGVSISRDTRHVGIAYVCGTALNLFLLFVSVGRLGIIAVPLCLSVSRLTAYIYLYIVSRKKVGYRLPNALLLLLAVAAIGGYLLQRG
ncbi:MAG: oligosaccharide flippase family protein [Bacteroidales bacterium]|nr:oligosaccharide flippase family protein [Bacteroidales bacterium]